MTYAIPYKRHFLKYLVVMLLIYYVMTNLLNCNDKILDSNYKIAILRIAASALYPAHFL